MKLIYIHIKNFNDLIYDQEINLSNSSKVSLEKNTEKNFYLKIDEIDNSIENFYGENIKNITLILGKNGRGKTSIMDILGMKENDRNCEGVIKPILNDLLDLKGNNPDKVRIEYSEENVKSDNYMLVYKISDKKYFIEIHGNYHVSRVNNINWSGYQIDIHEKLTGFIIKKTGDKFEVINDKILSQVAKGNICLSYITRNKSDRLKSPYDIRDYNDKFNSIHRHYRYKSGHSIAYKYANFMIKQNKNLDFNNKNFNISIAYDRQKFNDLEIEEKVNQDDYIDKIKSLKTFLYIETENYDDYTGQEYFKINNLTKHDRELESVKNNRDKFILNFLSQNIIDMVLNGLYSIAISRENNKDIKKRKQVQKNKFNKFISQLCGDVTYVNSIKLLGTPVNFDQEMDYLKTVMEYVYHKDVKEYKKLIYICRYLHSRIDADYTIVEYGAAYQDSIEEIVSQLMEIEESYFTTEDKLTYRFPKEDEEFYELLKIYDKYTKPTNDETDSSNLKRILDVKYNNLSEGQKTLFSIYTLMFEELQGKNSDDLIVFLLDEPDQSLHPEWSRIFISEICKEVEKYDAKVQFIITTHSPFIVSDIVSENVCLLMSNEEYKNITGKEAKGDVELRTLSELNITHNTFGANIHEILKLGFVLNRTIGEFAYSKITNWIKAISESNDIDSLNEINNDHFNLIGEKVIRDKINDLYKNKQQKIINEKIERTKELMNIVRDFIVEEDVKKLDELKQFIVNSKREK